MFPPEKDIANRRQVWRVLSDLFLDTELQTEDVSTIARALATSIYTLAEIEEILYREVYPVCISNLTSVAGEWAGVDDEWLEKAILEHSKHKSTLGNALQPNRGMIREDWERIKKEYADLA